MLAVSFCVLSLMSSALALATNYPRGPGGKLIIRDDDTTEQDLFDSCPGRPGSDKFKRADLCTLVSNVLSPLS